MPDDNALDAEIEDFLRKLAIVSSGLDHLEPNDEILAALEEQLASGHMRVFPGERAIPAHADHLWIRHAHRAGAVCFTELRGARAGKAPPAAKLWPATDLVFLAQDPPGAPARTVVRVEVRDGDRWPLRISPFVNYLMARAWFAFPRFTVSRYGAVAFERPVSNTMGGMVTKLRDDLLEAAVLVSERHQRLMATRH
jgi:hypothetical protein